MLDSNYLANISDGAEEISAQLHSEILKRIVERITERIGNEEDYILTATDKWQIETLQEAGYLLKDIQKEIAKKTGLERAEIAKAYKDAGGRQIAYDRQTYKNAGIEIAESMKQSPAMLRILQAGYERSVQTWLNFTGTTLAREAYMLFIRECDKAFNLVLSGAEGWTKAYMDAVNNIVNDGVKVTYPTGHVDTIETATARAIRTGVAQACGKVTATRAAENGVTLFLTSAHQGARPTHEVWQGKVFWVDWAELAERIGIGEYIGEYPEASEEEKKKYPEFCRTTDIGTVTGLEGANCRHSYGAFFEGMSNPYDGMNFDDEMYNKEQHARLLERRIRSTKRDIETYKTALKATENEEIKADLNKQIEKKNNTLKRQIKGYYGYCEENELKPQEARLFIGA